MKFEAEVTQYLDLCKELSETKTHEGVLAELGKTREDLDRDFQIGVDNGYSVEQQIGMVKLVVLIAKK